MTQARQYRLSAVVESTLGTTPTNPTMLTFEVSSASGTINAPKLARDTVRTDGNVAGTVSVSRSASFSRTQELIYPTVNEALWTEIRAGLRTSAEVAQSAGVTVTMAGGDAKVIRASGSFATDDFAIGDIVVIAGSATAANNGAFRVTALSTTSNPNDTLTLEKGDTYTFTADAGGGITVTRGARMVNGTTDRSFSIEEAWLDTQKMVGWTGMRVGSIEFGFSMGGKSTYRASYVGFDGTPAAMASATVGFTGGLGYAAPTANPVLSDAAAIQVVAADATIPARSFTVTHDCGARVRHDISGSTAVPSAAPTGASRVRVSMEVYASVLTQLTQLRAGTEMAVWCYMPDPNGKAVAVSMGTVVWDSASLPMQGIDSDAMVNVTGVATLNSTEGYTLRFLRFQ